MAGRSEYTYRGREIKRTARPSKNRNFGDLSRWWVPSLDRKQDDILALLGRDGRSLFQTRIDAERAVDEALDGPLKDRARVEGARIVIDNPGRAYQAYRGKTGTVRSIEYHPGYNDQPYPGHATVEIDGGETIRIPTFTFKPIPPTDAEKGDR